MNSPDPSTTTALRPARAPTRGKARARAAALPLRPGGRAPDEKAIRILDGFSVARICAAFQARRADHFPATVDDAAFGLLVDLFLSEWLGSRVGAQQPGAVCLESAAALTPGVIALVESGLAVVTRQQAPDETDEAATISLSRAGRARLDSYFDYMADYMSII